MKVKEWVGRERARETDGKREEGREVRREGGGGRSPGECRPLGGALVFAPRPPDAPSLP